MRKLSFLLVSSCLGLAACSANITADSPEKKGGVEPLGIAGPNIDGVWASECVADFGDSKKITLVVKGKEVSRTTEAFAGRFCAGSSRTRTLNGTMLFRKALPKDIYEVEYRFAIGNGATSLTAENLRRDGKTLFISDFRAGEGMDPDIALGLIGDVK